MNKIIKICFFLAGVGLILDAIFMIFNIPNPLGIGLPCPINLITLSIGLILTSLKK